MGSDKKREEGKGEGGEKGWFPYETRVDEKGRLNVPPDIREEMGIYRKPAKVAVKVKVLKLFVKGEREGE